MRLDPHNGNLILLIGVRLQGESQVGHEHGEGGFVDGEEGVVGGGGGEFGAEGTEARGGLRCSVDGDAEGGAGADHLLRGGDYFRVFEDGGAEFLLDIADAVRGDLEGMIGTEGWRGIQESGILWVGGMVSMGARRHILGSTHGIFEVAPF